MLRIRVLLLLTRLDKCCGVGLFSSNNGSFFWRDIWVSSGVGLFSSNKGSFLVEIFESVHWEMIGSLKTKEIRYEMRYIRQITDDKLILKKIT